jgi:hypothetical protein
MTRVIRLRCAQCRRASVGSIDRGGHTCSSSCDHPALPDGALLLIQLDSRRRPTWHHVSVLDLDHPGHWPTHWHCSGCGYTLALRRDQVTDALARFEQTGLTQTVDVGGEPINHPRLRGIAVRPVDP